MTQNESDRFFIILFTASSAIGIGFGILALSLGDIPLSLGDILFSTIFFGLGILLLICGIAIFKLEKKAVA